MRGAVLVPFGCAHEVVVAILPGLPATPGECRVCGCIDSMACATEHGPCSWVDADHTLCSACLPPPARRKPAKGKKKR